MEMLNRDLLNLLPGLFVGSILTLAGSYLVVIADKTNLVNQRQYEQAAEIAKQAEDVAIGAEELVYELTRGRETSDPPYAFNDPQFQKIWHVWRLKAQSLRGRSALVFQNDPAMHFVDNTVIDKIAATQRPQSIIEIQIPPRNSAKTIDQKIKLIWRNTILQRDVSRWIDEEVAKIKEKKPNTIFPQSEHLSELEHVQDELDKNITEATNNIRESNQKILLQYNIALSNISQF